MQTYLAIDLISADPAIRNGQPCVAGTGLRVTDIAIAHLFHRRTPDEVAADYELSAAQVYAALAYYYQHKPELDDNIRRQIAESRQLRESRRGGETSLLS